MIKVKIEGENKSKLEDGVKTKKVSKSSGRKEETLVEELMRRVEDQEMELREKEKRNGGIVEAAE